MEKKYNIPYGRQSLDKIDKFEVIKSLNQKFITTGKYVEKFEKALKEKFGSKFAYSCSSGTAGLHLAFMSINLKKGDVVLMPSINFISSYRTADLLGAKIFLVDVDGNNGQMTPENIYKCIKENNLSKIKAVVSMYLGGYVENNIDLYYLKKKFGFYLIEDACHALGSQYKYKKKYFSIGSCMHSDVCVFSFHPVKTITTGEGGAVLTRNKKIASEIKKLRNHGILRGKNYWNYDINRLGFNYRLSDINCALGLAQLKKLKLFSQKRKKIFDFYIKRLYSYKNYFFFPQAKNKRNLYHLFLIGLNFKKIKKNKNSLITFLNKKGVFPQFHYKPIFEFSFFKKKTRKSFPGTMQYYKNFLSLPIFYNLNENQQLYIIKSIINYVKTNKK